MTLLMKNDFLHPLLLKHLHQKDSFPTELPRRSQALQIIHFTSFREKGESWKAIWGVISDKHTSIACQFSADCCNEFEEMMGRRLSEFKGALISAEKWELNINPVQKLNTLKAVIKIDELKSLGNEGEATIGDPRDFNTYRDVKDVLADPKRRAIYLGRLPEQQEYRSQRQEYSSQHTPQFETQADPLQQSKRRKLNKEDPPGWKEVKTVSYKDYQISPAQQGMLDSDATWVTPQNLHEYQMGPSSDAAPAVATTTAIDQDHPPLSSPEPSSQAIQQDDSQFHTQAPPVMDESQFRRKQNEPKNPEVTEEYEWEPTPPVAKEKQIARAKSPSKLDAEPEVLEWEPTPPRPSKTIKTTMPPLESDEEMERDESPASQAPIDDEPPSSPIQGEVLFQEDSQREPREFFEDNYPSPSMKVSTAELLTQELMDVEKDQSLEIVEATEIVVQGAPEEHESAEKEANADVVEVQELEDDGLQGEEMEDVQLSVLPTQTEASASIVENSVETEKRMEQPTPLPPPKEVAQSTVLQLQTLLSTTQDVSTSTQYPNSTPSNRPRSTQEPSQITTTQDDSQRSKLAFLKGLKLTPPISSTPTPSTPQPSSYLSQRHFSPPHQQTFQISPPKATPSSTSAPASAQLQVKETPLPGRVAQQAHIPFTNSTTRISATAPSPVGPAEPDLRRRYKRDRHVGPIIPRFSRRERKMNCDLRAILLEDRKKFEIQKEEGGDDVRNAMQTDIHREELVEKSFETKKLGTIEPEIPVQNAAYGNAVMEEIVEASFNTEIPRTFGREASAREVQVATQEATIMQGIVEERVEKKGSEGTDSKTLHRALQTEMQGDEEEAIVEETVEKSLKAKTPKKVERNEEVVVTRVKNVTGPPLKPQLDDTQDDSQTFDAAQSRWGRFATHWRRFSSK